MNILILVAFLTITLYYIFFNKKHFLVVFITCSMLFPSSLGEIYNNITYSYTRIASILIPLILLFYKTKHTNFGNYKKYIILYFIFIFLEFISSALSAEMMSSYLGYIVDDFLQTIGFLFIFIHFYNYEAPHKEFVKILKTISIITFFVSIIGIIEIATKKGIFDIIGLTEYLNRGYTGSGFREGGASGIYKISSIFNDSLQFGYYIALTTPIILLCLRIFRTTTRFYNLNIFNFLVSFLLIYNVNSRTAFIMMIIILLLITLYYFWQLLGNSILHHKSFFLIFFISLFIAIQSFNLIFNNANMLLGIDRVYSTDESLKARNSQVDYSLSLLSNESLFWGTGRINTFKLVEKNNLPSLDSMWIRTYLESGPIALLIIILIYIIPLVNLINNSSKKRLSPNIAIYLIAFFSAYIIMSTFSSNNEYRILFFLYITLYLYLINNKITFQSLRINSSTK